LVGQWPCGTSATSLSPRGAPGLEAGAFRLVAESIAERNLLLRNAPHLVKPLPTVVPFHASFSGIIPSIKRFFPLKAKLVDHGLLVVEFGLALYDWLGRQHRTTPQNRRPRQHGRYSGANAVHDFCTDAAACERRKGTPSVPSIWGMSLADSGRSGIVCRQGLFPTRICKLRACRVVSLWS
jgi:hypothetical protein